MNNLNKGNPIGVFDSGIGGMSILKEIIKLLPNEDFIYLGDSANAPYGEKTEDQIIDLCKKNTEWLLAKQCKLIVVACNTATTNAITVLREQYNVPFIGIEPAIKPAALNSVTRKIGVLATKGTLSSKLFAKATDKYSLSTETQIIEVIGKGLVEYIEKGDFESEALEGLLIAYLTPLINQNIDYLVLGCSHYPFLMPLLKKILPTNVAIIDSGEAVAKQTKTVLLKEGILNTKKEISSIYIHTNKLLNVFENVAKKHLNRLNSHFIDIISSII